ncbi:MAG: type IX secretion system membrane protein PorP/SprF [Microscillaceae bacterium]|nr:type IX secretion system membrane protein PorP/SprF [Microscillaceae bacterium]MDW8460376.1 type IX secretion system membrane protein PorP/SprF [Cytophagales bacterium]
MKKITFPLFLLWGFFCCTIQAQDPQLSQNYATPMYLNPAFTGGTDDSRASLLHRIQWPKIGAVFNTSVFSFDHNFEEYNSGVGLMVSTTQISEAALKTTEIHSSYGYRLKLDEEWAIRSGLQLGYAIRSLGFSQLTFGDQYDNNGLTGALTAERFATDQISYLDINSGTVIYNKRFWLGVAGHHLNRPSQDIVRIQGQNRLPIRFSVHGGVRLPLSKYEHRPFGRKYRQNYETEEANLSPMFLYKRQGNFDQLDIGAYFAYESLVLGLWYRGIPIKQYVRGIYNNESIVALVGVHYNGIHVGYSYDHTISNLAGNTGGVHEITLSYLFEPYAVRHGTKTKNRGGLPTPEF